jgi:mxaJ protein
MTTILMKARAQRSYSHLVAGLLSLLSLGLVGNAAESASPTEAMGSNTLRVCASATQLPYSAKDGSGFENKIARAVADAMGRQVQFVWSDRPAIYLVRDFLDKKLCDVIVGLDTDDSRVLTTKPYYRAGYVFITRTDSSPEIHSWSDPRIRNFKHIAVAFGTPGEQMLRELGKYDDDFNYEKSLVNFRSARNEYVQISPSRMVAEVADGNAEMAIGFAPEVARYVRESKVPLRMTAVDDDTFKSTGERIPQAFDQSMGVRKDDADLKAALDAALVKARSQIDGMLRAEGVPLLDPRS